MPFDPYPYVFLNLVLSMLAAVQAPIIMMSQNRQAARDRMTMIRDFGANLKADAAISELNQRLDHLAWQVLADLDQIKRAQKIDHRTWLHHPQPGSVILLRRRLRSRIHAPAAYAIGHVSAWPMARWSSRRRVSSGGCAQSGGRWASRPGVTATAPASGALQQQPGVGFYWQVQQPGADDGGQRQRAQRRQQAGQAAQPEQFAQHHAHHLPARAPRGAQ